MLPTIPKNYFKLGNIPSTLPGDEVEKILNELQKTFNQIIGSSKKVSFGEQFKKDATDAAYRVAAGQLTTGIRNLLLMRLRKSDSEKAVMMAVFLDTEMGKALLQMVAGVALSQLSYSNKSPKITRLLKEFRVAGMTTASNAIFTELMDSVVPLLGDAFGKAESATLIEEMESEDFSSARYLHQSI